MERIMVAVADLIPGDVVIAEGKVVNGYPYGGKSMPGTVVPYDWDGVMIGKYYPDPETPFQVLR